MIYPWEAFIERPAIRDEDKMDDLCFCKLHYRTEKGGHSINYLLATFNHGWTSFGWNNKLQKFCVVYTDWNYVGDDPDMRTEPR